MITERSGCSAARSLCSEGRGWLLLVCITMLQQLYKQVFAFGRDVPICTDSAYTVLCIWGLDETSSPEFVQKTETTVNITLNKKKVPSL